MNDYDLAEASRKRFWAARDNVVSKLNELAHDVSRIQERDHKGKRRELASVIGQTTHTIMWGLANLPLDQMASWAESVHEIQAHEAAQPKPSLVLCGYSVTDPDRHCVLDPDHTLPYNGGIEHVSADGVHFV